MAFVVEDGTGLSDANALISVEFADDYFSTRGNTDWTGDETAKQAAIVLATDYIGVRWGERLLGCPLKSTQALVFPRADLWYNGVPVHGVPANVQKATAEYALRALTNALMPDPVTDETGLQVQSRREKVGPIEEEVSYAASAGRASLIKPYPLADGLISIYARASGGRNYR